MFRPHPVWGMFLLKSVMKRQTKRKKTAECIEMSHHRLDCVPVSVCSWDDVMYKKEFRLTILSFWATTTAVTHNIRGSHSPPFPKQQLTKCWQFSTKVRTKKWPQQHRAVQAQAHHTNRSQIQVFISHDSHDPRFARKHIVRKDGNLFIVGVLIMLVVQNFVRIIVLAELWRNHKLNHSSDGVATGPDWEGCQNVDALQHFSLKAVNHWKWKCI